MSDLALPGVLHAVFARSPVAHARIRSVASAQARGTPGVVLVLDGAELERALPPVRDNQMPLPSKWESGDSAPHPQPAPAVARDGQSPAT